MATYGTLTASLEDYKGKTATARIRVPEAKATQANAKKLADFLKVHSDAKVVSYGASKDYSGDSTDTGKYDRVLQRLELLFEDGDGKSKRFSIHAPRDEDVNDDQEPDSDLAEDVKDLLVAVGAGSNFTYNGGGLESRKPSKQARAKVMTGV